MAFWAGRTNSWCGRQAGGERGLKSDHSFRPIGFIVMRAERERVLLKYFSSVFLAGCLVCLYYVHYPLGKCSCSDIRWPARCDLWTRPGKERFIDTDSINHGWFLVPLFSVLYEEPNKLTMENKWRLKDDHQKAKEPWACVCCTKSYTLKICAFFYIILISKIIRLI